MSYSLTGLELSRILFSLDRGEAPTLTREQAYGLADILRKPDEDEKPPEPEPSELKMLDDALSDASCELSRAQDCIDDARRSMKKATKKSAVPA